MTPHQQRVLKEKQDLDEKITKLASFTETDFYINQLEPQEKHRLAQQWDIMIKYSRILGERIAAFQPDFQD
jgi:hypothetical protein